MSGPEPGVGFDEFDFIAEVLRPLTDGAPEALGLLDDAALIAGREGHELVVTTDAMVAGVHFLHDDPPELVARKLLRVNLSDMAAKGATPYGYFLTTCWPASYAPDQRRRFAAGLKQDQGRFGLRLFGGDTTQTPGPLTVSATMLGWVKQGRMVQRSTAQAGDVVLVSGSIGDGWLGLAAARGQLQGMDEGHLAYLTYRYRLPQPRVDLAAMTAAHASAAADISDGLIADAGHVARASSVGMVLDLDRLPLSPASRAWLSGRDPAEALAALATGGDDYELVCCCRSARAAALMDAAAQAGGQFTVVGEVVQGSGVQVMQGGQPLAIDRPGWRHG